MNGRGCSPLNAQNCCKSSGNVKLCKYRRPSERRQGQPASFLLCREKLHQLGDAVDASPVVQQRLSLVMGTMSVLHGAETADALISDAVQLARQVRNTVPYFSKEMALLQLHHGRAKW